MLIKNHVRGRALYKLAYVGASLLPSFYWPKTECLLRFSSAFIPTLSLPFQKHGHDNYTTCNSLSRYWYFHD